MRAAFQRGNRRGFLAGAGQASRLSFPEPAEEAGGLSPGHSIHGTSNVRCAVLASLLVLGLAVGWPRSLKAAPAPGRQNAPAAATTSRAARDEAVRSIPYDKLPPAAKAKVLAVLSDVSFFRRLPVQVVQCDPDLYLFLVRHPDVVINLWDVMGITQVDMVQTGPGTFRMADPAGTKGSVEFLYSTHDTHLIYTEGSYDGPLFARPVVGRGLIVLKSGYVREPDGRYYITCRLDTFMRVENLGAEILTKTFSPLVGKVADANLAYTASFVGSLSRTAETNHEGVQRLAEKLARVQPEVRQEFSQVAERVAQRAAQLAEHDFRQPTMVADKTAAEPSQPQPGTK